MDRLPRSQAKVDSEPAVGGEILYQTFADRLAECQNMEVASHRCKVWNMTVRTANHL